MHWVRSFLRLCYKSLQRLYSRVSCFSRQLRALWSCNLQTNTPVHQQQPPPGSPVGWLLGPTRASPPLAHPVPTANPPCFLRCFARAGVPILGKTHIHDSDPRQPRGRTLWVIALSLSASAEPFTQAPRSPISPLLWHPSQTLCQGGCRHWIPYLWSFFPLCMCSDVYPSHKHLHKNDI